MTGGSVPAKLHPVPHGLTDRPRRLARLRFQLLGLLGLEREPPAASALDEAAALAPHLERALRRVAAAAEEVCESWAAGLDLDEPVERLRAELRVAGEFEVR